MQLIITIHGEVDDHVEATTIRTAIDTALSPFTELDLKTTSQVIQPIPIPPSPE